MSISRVPAKPNLYLVQKPQKIDIPIGVYVNTEIDANRAVSLDFQ